jgi:hypothetical protein
MHDNPVIRITAPTPPPLSLLRISIPTTPEITGHPKASSILESLDSPPLLNFPVNHEGLSSDSEVLCERPTLGPNVEIVSSSTGSVDKDLPLYTKARNMPVAPTFIATPSYHVDVPHAKKPRYISSEKMQEINQNLKRLYLRRLNAVGDTHHIVASSGTSERADMLASHDGTRYYKEPADTQRYLSRGKIQAINDSLKRLYFERLDKTQEPKIADQKVLLPLRSTEIFTPPSDTSSAFKQTYLSLEQVQQIEQKLEITGFQGIGYDWRYMAYELGPGSWSTAVSSTLDAIRKKNRDELGDFIPGYSSTEGNAYPAAETGAVEHQNQTQAIDAEPQFMGISSKDGTSFVDGMCSGASSPCFQSPQERA